jgi:hypothetical protein
MHALGYTYSYSTDGTFDNLVSKYYMACTRRKDGSGLGSGQISVVFGSCGFEFGDDFSPTVFGFGFGFGFGFPPVDIQWIFEINHLELKLMFYNMLIITCLLRLLNLFKFDS